MFGARGAERKTVKTARRWTCEKLSNEQTVSLSGVFSPEVSGCEISARPFICVKTPQPLKDKKL
jgi:hypothetical protein